MPTTASTDRRSATSGHNTSGGFAAAAARAVPLHDASVGLRTS
jgi:hypothetical protein